MYSVTFYCPEDQTKVVISHEKWDIVVNKAFGFINDVVYVNLSLMNSSHANSSLHFSLLDLHSTIKAILHYGIVIGTQDVNNICYSVNDLKWIILQAIGRFVKSLRDLDEDERAEVVSKIDACMDDVFKLINQYFSHL